MTITKFSSQYDAKTKSSFTVQIDGPSYAQVIKGQGYFIIPNPQSKFVSFSKANKDTCLGDIVSDIIPEYTNEQYANDYGDRHLGTGKTVREYMRDNLRIKV